MFKASLSDIGIFRDSISTIAELIDEGTFKIRKDGISLLATDRAMVAAVDFKISSSAFEKYEIDKDIAIGLNITNLLSVLKRAGADDKLSLSLQDSKLEVFIEGASRRRFVLPLLDLSEEDLPQIQQLEEQFSSRVVLRPSILQSGIDDAEIIADSVLIRTSNNKFVMKAEGDISQAELELEKGNEALIEIKSDSEVKSRYPLDYLKKMVKAAKIADSVSIHFGQDFPAKLAFKSGDKVSLNMILAPRVSEE